MANYQPKVLHPQSLERGAAHSFDVEAFDDGIRSQGVTLVHWRAMGCPLGMITKDDAMRRTHVGHPDCSNGFLYRRVGEVTSLWTGNSQSSGQQDFGVLDSSTVHATFPRTYDSQDGQPGPQVYVAPFDRFYLAEEAILWPHWEIIEHDPSGVDRLRFPAAKVELLLDNRLEEYRQGVDFELLAGRIHWTGTRRPGIDQDTGSEQRGRVCSVRYLYQPYWYVERLDHAARVVQSEDQEGRRVVTRMPFSVTLVKEQVFEDRVRGEDADGHQDPRENRAPSDSGFPAR